MLPSGRFESLSSRLPSANKRQTLSIFIEFHSPWLNVCRFCMCIWVLAGMGGWRVAAPLASNKGWSLRWPRGCVRPHPSREILPPLGLWHVLRHVLSGFTGRASLRHAINLLSSLCLPNANRGTHSNIHTYKRT